MNSLAAAYQQFLQIHLLVKFVSERKIKRFKENKLKPR